MDCWFHLNYVSQTTTKKRKVRVHNRLNLFICTFHQHNPAGKGLHWFSPDYTTLVHFLIQVSTSGLNISEDFFDVSSASKKKQKNRKCLLCVQSCINNSSVRMRRLPAPLNHQSSAMPMRDFSSITLSNSLFFTLRIHAKLSLSLSQSYNNPP